MRKEKAIPNKMWRIAGESLRSQPLSAVEQEQLSDEFSSYRSLRSGDDTVSTWVTPADARRHQSAAQAVAAFLCERYAGRYGREATVDLRQRFKAAFLDYTDRALEVYTRLKPVDRLPPPFLGQACRI